MCEVFYLSFSQNVNSFVVLTLRFCSNTLVCVSPGAADGGQVSAEEPAGSEGRGQVELVETFLPSASSSRRQHGQRKALG